MEDEIFLKNIEHKALLLKGSWFVGEKGVGEEKLFFRATYAAAPFEQIREAVRRFGVALREVFHLSDEELKTNGHS